MCQQCTRRDFLGCTAVGGLLLATGGLAAGGRQASASPVRTKEKVKICTIFAGNPGVPGRGWTLTEAEVTAMKARLAEAEKNLGNVEFVIGRANNAAEAAALMAQAGDGAPVLAINMMIRGLLNVMPPVLESGRPAAVFSVPGTGHDWMYPFRWQREGKPVTLFASSDYADLERAASLLRVPALLRKSRVLIIPPMQGTPASCSPERAKERLGADLVAVNQARFDELITAVDPKAAEAEADRWLKGAKRTVEPQREDVLKAAQVSLAMDQLIEEEGAQALAIGTCMAWLPRGFPCLGFTRLRDRGIPASCEGDMDSLWTMLMFEHAFGIAGFQGNATIDTARNAIWTAHCVGPLKMDGPDGPEAPYLLRSHSEIGYGVVPEVQYRIGQKVTRAKFVNLDTMLISGGTIMEVPEVSVRACRTQIVTEIPDAEALARNWSTGIESNDMMTLLHRVVFYGDHTPNLQHLGDLMGFRIIREG
jgi:hypothetical protein